jgi:hypothetical protein
MVVILILQGIKRVAHATLTYEFQSSSGHPVQNVDLFGVVSYLLLKNGLELSAYCVKIFPNSFFTSTYPVGDLIEQRDFGHQQKHSTMRGGHLLISRMWLMENTGLSIFLCLRC